MRRTLILAFALIRIVCAALLVLGLALPAAAQKKPKDPVLQQYLVEQFAQLNTKLDQLGERLTALEAEQTRLKQAQSELMTELRSTQTIVKTTDTSLSTFRLSSQQDLFSLKTDLTDVRQQISRLADQIMKSLPPAPAAPAPAEQPTTVEGYITAVDEQAEEVTINLGSNAGVREGSEFSVFKASDPKREVGIIQVLQVLDANNSRAKVVFVRPSFKFEFSDIVRPRT
jgi:septal ring factor EnvC (AmiA/AmiB activator)